MMTRADSKLSFPCVIANKKKKEKKKKVNFLMD